MPVNIHQDLQAELNRFRAVCSEANGLGRATKLAHSWALS